MDGGAGRYIGMSHDRLQAGDMTRAPRILAGLALAAITTAIALTPPAWSDARDAGGHKRPDIGARHGHRTIR